MKRLAIIPARLGSKRIPRKNIKDFLGKPIIAYSIESALSSQLFDTVMVSTDHDMIATVARQHGAEVPFLRSVKNASDTATTLEVILEVLEEYHRRNLDFGQICCLYPTAPFVSASLLTSAFERLEKGKFDTVFPVLRYSYPIQRAFKMDTGQKISMIYPDQINTRSQDLEAAYHDAGQFYCFNKKAILDNQKLWTDNTGGILISEMEGHDIDTEEDWKIAEFKYQVTFGKSA
ncbi:MAG: pseudaminic acid cytidylyltransferase [Saprospiraceae bacterium]|nr:pseudaminic acid cytidylyltransferase [Saprospiraceae bacterium]